MLENIHTDLKKRSYFEKTTLDNWFFWAETYILLTIKEQKELSTLISTHTGIPYSRVEEHLKLKKPDITILHQDEEEAIHKINIFLKKQIFKYYSIDSLAINRFEWLVLLKEFERLKRSHLSINFFIDCLSSLRKVSFESLETLFVTPRVIRHSERNIARSDTAVSGKRNRNSFFNPEENPLIVDANIDQNILQALKKTGVCERELSFTSPIRGYTTLKSTGSGRKVRPVCDINKTILYKEVTPYGKNTEKARADLRQASSEAILNELPRLNYKRAEDVEFIATREQIEERRGKKRRRSQNSLMGASATDVFQAHGVEITYAHKKAHHWAHLIAHFLCDSNEVGEINLIPSTAAANYNTLEIIEQFIRNTLMNKETEEIHIHVKPCFSGEGMIPEQLIYTLNWNSINAKGILTPKTNVYYINPQSYNRITKAMLASIELLNQIPSDSIALEEDESDLEFFPKYLF